MVTVGVRATFDVKPGNESAAAEFIQRGLQIVDHAQPPSTVWFAFQTEAVAGQRRRLRDTTDLRTGRRPRRSPAGHRGTRHSRRPEVVWDHQKRGCPGIVSRSAMTSARSSSSAMSSAAASACSV